jgi:ubiquinone/menaquinone biosynthesis C-methylase UbiE
MQNNLLNYYATTDEAGRLTRVESELELVRTRDILLRHLPSPPAAVLDVGGGPAIHSFWLAALGYDVHLVDIVPLHIDQARAAECASQKTLASITLGDACDLQFEAGSMDAVVMLGPLYHLTRREDRLKALSEAQRVLRPGGVLLAGAISRYIPIVKILTRNILDERSMAVARRTAHTGQHRPDPDLDFFTTAFFHHPSGLEKEIKQSGFHCEATLAVEGPARLLGEQFAERWSQPIARQWILDITRKLEADRSMLGVSGHIISVARKPS